MSYFEAKWCSLDWTPWTSFTAMEAKWKLIPNEKGVYRVRPTNTSIIAYIGETGRRLRDILNSLRRGTMADLMPFSDSNTAAPNLWAWRQELHWNYECSTATVKKSKAKRRAIECLLLWKYRLERGESTLCNYGRFHKNYLKSTDSSRNMRGFRLPEPHLNSSWGPSFPPLRPEGKPLDDNWMGINWNINVPLSLEASDQVPNVPGLYRILNQESSSLKYIGETMILRSCFKQHCRNFGDNRLFFSFSKQSPSIKDFQLHELATDLIGAYYYQTSTVPTNQFFNMVE